MEGAPEELEVMDRLGQEGRGRMPEAGVDPALVPPEEVVREGTGEADRSIAVGAVDKAATGAP